MTSTSRTHVLATAEVTAAVTVADQGAGLPFLLLHGGGPQTVTGFADLLARARPARMITLTHPGFATTPRPAALASVGGLAALYVTLLDEMDLAGVTLVGNSVGAWIAAEMALLHSPPASARPSSSTRPGSRYPVTRSPTFSPSPWTRSRS